MMVKSLFDLIKNRRIKVSPNCVEIGDLFYRVSMAVGYPHRISDGWLHPLVLSKEPFDICLHIKPKKSKEVVAELEKELAKEEEEIAVAEKKGVVTKEQKELLDLDRLNYERIKAGKEKVFDMSLYLGVRAFSEEKLMQVSRKVESLLNLVKIIPKAPFLSMLDGLKSVTPFGEDKLKMNRVVTSEALAASFPFVTDSMEGVVEEEKEVVSEEVKAFWKKFVELGKPKPENLEVYKMEKPFYLRKELSPTQIGFLKGYGFEDVRLCGLDNYSQHYLVKKPSLNESIAHSFMVNLIAEEARKYSHNVTVGETVCPDIVFERNGEYFAFEVETGSQAKNLSDLTAKTAKNNSSINPKYAKWWFVVTDKLLKSVYSKYHETLTRTGIRDTIRDLFYVAE